MIFCNDGKTKEVEFINWYKVHDKKNFLSNRNTEERTLIKASLKEIQEKNYSLNYKKYVNKKWNLHEDDKLVKLSDIKIAVFRWRNRNAASQGFNFKIKKFKF